MKTQTFTAPTLKEALAKVKQALGEDALIVKSERVKAAGSFSFAKRELIQVTAMLPGDESPEVAGPEFAETLEKRLSEESPAPSLHDIGTLKDEIRALQAELESLGKHLRNSRLPALPRELTRVWEQLERAGVDRNWATELAQEALVQLNPETLESHALVSRYVQSQLSRSVRPAPLMTATRKIGYKIALVGSPGAGKTTLLQKLASDPNAYGKKKTGVLSLDTHRMAAVEQIRAFSRIAGTPLEVVYRPDQIAEALARLNDCELILIDTAGCPAHDQERMAGLAEFIESIDPDEIHLVLNATVRDEELIFACERYRDLNITHLDFTRLDESRRYGFLLNVIRSAAKPVAWLSSGQGFLNCLERFTTDVLRSWITRIPAEAESSPEVSTLTSA